MKNNTTSKNTSTLPELLSQVLNHPDLPEEMGNELERAVSEIFNEHVDQSEIMAYEKSVPYLEMLLRGYQAKRGDFDEEAEAIISLLDSNITTGIHVAVTKEVERMTKFGSIPLAEALREQRKQDAIQFERENEGGE